MKRNCHFWKACKVDEEHFVYSEASFNGLFALDIKTGQSRFVCSFPEDDNVLAAHRCFGCVGDRIFFFPYFGKYLSVFYQSGIEETIRVPEMSEIIYAAKVRDNFLLFSRKGKGGIYRFDYREMRIESEEVFSQAIRSQTNDGFIFQIEDTIAEDDAFIYTVVNSSGTVVRINKTDSNVADVYKIGEEISAIHTFRGGLWLAAKRKNCVWRIDLLTSQITTYRIPTKRGCVDDILFRFAVAGDMLILLPMKESRVWVYREQIDRFEVLFDANVLCVGGIRGDYKLFSDGLITEDALFITPLCGYAMVRVDLKSGEALAINLHYEASFQKQREAFIRADMREMLRINPILQEDAYHYTLEKFIVGI